MDPPLTLFLINDVFEENMHAAKQSKWKWELFSATKQSFVGDKIILSISQTAVNIVSQWWIKMKLNKFTISSNQRYF